MYDVTHSNENLYSRKCVFKPAVENQKIVGYNRVQGTDLNHKT